MGVSGCGKSTIGVRLASELGMAFIEGDEFHSKAGRIKMASGRPLSDEDRMPWLDRLGETLALAPRSVVACSALRRTYRDRIRDWVPDAQFVYLKGDRRVVLKRTMSRSHDFMPVELLGSQYSVLEPPQPDEAAFTVAVGVGPDRVVRTILERLGHLGPGTIPQSPAVDS
ncbi:gluconokinase [Pseudolysinimonas yzui]